MQIEQLELELFPENSGAVAPRRLRGKTPAPESAGRSGGKGVLGVQPLGEWGAPKPQVEGRGKAFPPMTVLAVALAGLALHADVTCAWNGSNYECSGEGNRVIVAGGGVIELPPVTTNIVGVCTNCSSISPADLRELADEIERRAYVISYQACEGLKDSITTQKSLNSQMLYDISTYYRCNGIADSTNYMYTTDNSQTQVMKGIYQRPIPAFQYQVIGACKSVYDYATTYVKPQIEQTQTQLNTDYQQVEGIQRACNLIIDPLCAQLRAGAVECEASWDGSGGEGDGGSVTNTATGNWCTYEQGEALKKLLGAISNEVTRVRYHTAAISNFTEQCAYNIREGLFTEYNAIPRNEQLLGGTWQDIYLEGHETAWGYQPTNILARIELLLYGMSGVSSNSTAYSEDSPIGSTETLDNIDKVKDKADKQIRALDTDADGQAAQSLGQALTEFFEAFSPQTSEHGGDEVIPSVSFTLNEKEYYIEPLMVDERNTAQINDIRSMCNTAAGIVYSIVSAWLIFLYWRWFAEWAVKLSRWAVELITSLFAS